MCSTQTVGRVCLHIAFNAVQKPLILIASRVNVFHISFNSAVCATIKVACKDSLWDKSFAIRFKIKSFEIAVTYRILE